MVPLSPPDTLTLRIEEAARALNISRASIYRLLGEGKLSAIKIAGRTLIPADSLRALIDCAPHVRIRYGRCRQPETRDAA